MNRDEEDVSFINRNAVHPFAIGEDNRRCQGDDILAVGLYSRRKNIRNSVWVKEKVETNHAQGIRHRRMKAKDLVYDSVEVGKLGGRIRVVGAASMESEDFLSELFLYVRVLAQLDECPLSMEISIFP